MSADYTMTREDIVNELQGILDSNLDLLRDELAQAVSCETDADLTANIDAAQIQARRILDLINKCERAADKFVNPSAQRHR
jgi:hypothetical protein